jgi:hypothetical protein
MQAAFRYHSAWYRSIRFVVETFFYSVIKYNPKPQETIHSTFFIGIIPGVYLLREYIAKINSMK